MNLFYTPEYAKTGDVIPFYNQKTKRFENYYLKNWNPDAPKDKIVYGWHQIITEDNRIYTHNAPYSPDKSVGVSLKGILKPTFSFLCLLQLNANNYIL